jgi:hypothetical protein
MARTGGLRRGGRVAVALILAMAAGCGGGERRGGNQPVPPAPTTTAGEVAAFPDPLRAEARAPAPPAAVAPSAPSSTTAGIRLLSVPWTLVALSEGRRRVTVRYNVAGCTRLSHLAVRQSSRHVELGVVLADQRGAGRLCPAYVTSALSAVLLERPLGSRTLIHAPSTR